jgi:type IV pilus assembly protein PilX
MTGFFFLPCRMARQRGIALLAALLLMLAVLMTGIAAARAAIGAARISGHERERMLALHGAMAGLRDAEHDIEGGLDPGSARAAALAHADPAAFAEDCGGAPYEGLCRHSSSEDILALLADPEGPGVVLGAFSGARMPLGGGALAALPPRYLIELMPSGADAMLYRITVLGFGSAETSQAAVQAYYRKLLPEGASSPGLDAPGGPGAPGGPDTPGAPAPEGAPDSGPPPPGSTDPAQAPGAPGTPGGPGIRVGWREIGNWQESMAAHSARTERR